MTIEILTLFPAMLEGIIGSSILKRAQDKDSVRIRVHNLRDYAHDKHHTVDDRPFGGGPGMVLKCEPLVEAIETIQAMEATRARVIYLTPEGKLFKQAQARELSTQERLLFISGHYEGIDERVREGWIDEELSIGDYVLTNGTIAAGVVTDAIVRLIPGVLGNEESAGKDSFSTGETLLEGPHYTRPSEFRGMQVPEILQTGHHAEMEAWRHRMAVARTRERRPDLITTEDEKKTGETP